MNYLIFLVAVIAICICVSVSAEAEKKEESETAKFPDALARLLAEEFPAFASVFTYAACQQAGKWMNSFGGSVAIGNHLTFGGNVKASNARALGLLLSERVAPMFSHDFSTLIRNQPEESAWKIMRAFNAAKILAKA